jgi:hypothetical protein
MNKTKKLPAFKFKNENGINNCFGGGFDNGVRGLSSFM